MSTRSGRLIGLAVVLFWIVMMGFLALRELGGTGLRPAPQRSGNGDPPGESETSMGIFAGDERVGHFRTSKAPEPRGDRPGIIQEIEARAELNVLGRVTDLDIRGSVWRPREGTGAEFDFAVESGDYRFSIAGELSGGLLSADVTSAGESLPITVPIDDKLVFSSGIGSALEFPELDVGEAVRLESFDPLTLQKGSMRVRCVAMETIELGSGPISTRRLEVLASGIRSHVWIDDSGEVVKMTTPFGLTLQRIRPDEQAAEAPSAKIGPERDFLRLTAVNPSGKRPFRGARRSVVKIVTETGKPLPEDSTQQSLGNGIYRLSIPEEPPRRLTERIPAEERYLRSDAFIQSDHPKIRAAAREIVGGETDPWRRALEIHRWVNENVRKEVVVSLPSALEVLERRRGDCNEHTVLFAALARAAALPTRIAVGLVWSDELQGFFYHAWPEVFVGDWVWMDPTLGQPLADATHVKLLNGGIESWTGIVPYLGRIEIDVLEIDAGEEQESL